jgi:hypothetical protein
MGVGSDTTELKTEIRDCLESELGSEVTVEFVEATDRLDVRITDLGVADELRSRHDDVAVTTYSEHRFTVQLE